ncbi:hypothetical protein B0919_16880 [Hymenobacter sp. CRA2]|nr:hypothetical protein B0919_16880 [Hymenobacter sp. CRA2]
MQISVAADGTLWLLNQTEDGDALCTYNFAAATLQQVYVSDDQVIWLTAVAADCAYVVVNGPAQTWIGRVTAAGQMQQLGALPGGATAVQVAAAPDGTVWALDGQGHTYAYNASAAAFQAVAAPALAFSSVSVGSAELVVGLATQNGQGDATAWTWTPPTGWQPLAALQHTTGQWLAACSDGALWLLSGTVLTVLTPDGVVQAMDVSGIQYPSSWTAASRMSAYALGGVDEQFAIVPVALGVLDLPATPWPAQTPDQQLAYQYISTTLNITSPGGIRGQYKNKIAPLSSWQTGLAVMAAPANVPPADWQAVKTQINTELTYVQAVNNLFTELGTLTGYVGTMQADQLQGVATAVGLTVQAQGPSKVTVVLNSLVSTLVTRLGSLFPPPYGLVVSLIGSGLMAASNYTQQQYDPSGPQGSLKVAYSQLATAMAANIATTVTMQGNEQQTIVTDWGKLSAAGQAISQGIWTWPDNLTGQMLTGLEPVMQLYFYQALMPAAWQILQGIMVFSPLPPPVVPPHMPNHAMLTKSVTNSSYDLLVWYYICCALGSEANVVQNTGPYPSPVLMQSIFELGVNPEDVFGGQNGWALPTVQSPGWSEPPAAVGWQPYNPND